jgi:hypothetical protein
MKNMTFEEIQSKLNETLRLAEVKVGSKQGRLLECVYVQALRDAGMAIPAVVDVMLLSGRSVAGYKPPTKEVLDKYRNAQLGYDHGED